MSGKFSISSLLASERSSAIMTEFQNFGVKSDRSTSVKISLTVLFRPSVCPLTDLRNGDIARDLKFGMRIRSVGS